MAARAVSLKIYCYFEALFWLLVVNKLSRQLIANAIEFETIWRLAR